MAKIKYIITDIDGVLTDGRVSIDENGNERKYICFKDLDAIGIGRNNEIEFVFITGEDNSLVDYISKRFNVLEIYKGAKNKLAAIENICEAKKVFLNEICYIGDSDRDAEAVNAAGFGVAPNDGTRCVKNIADYITECNGGYGVLMETLDEVLLRNKKI